MPNAGLIKSSKTQDKSIDFNFINESYQYFNDLKKKYLSYCDYILSCITEEDIKKIDEIKKLYGMLEKDTFNIFEPLKNYEKEKFNEIILTQILNPKTKEIGNIAFLNEFCKFISEKTDYKFGNDVVVENQIGNNEYGYIDIFISDKENAVIIESKINDAPDQPNQLARYYKYVENVLEKKILGIVYIRPIYNEKKMPQLDTYDSKYASEIAEVKKLLIPVSVIDTNHNKDLCYFLDDCSRIATTVYSNNETKEKAKIYIQQYSELLKLKGGSKMLTGFEKEILRKLYSDAESVKKMQPITEICDNRWKILASIIKDSLYQKENGFSSADGDEKCTEKSIDEKISIVFTDYEDDDWGFGFWYKEGTSRKIQNSLENLLKNYKNKLLADKIENLYDWLIAKDFSFEIDQPIDDIVNEIKKMYKDLEKLAINKLKELK